MPVNFANPQQSEKDMVQLLPPGPAANLVMAFRFGLLYNVAAMNPEGYFSGALALMSTAGIQINVVLMVLNLLPIPPLDGGR